MWCVEKNFNEAGAIQSKTIEIDVALNRLGSSGTILMNFNGNHMSFIELNRKYEKPTIKSGWRPPIHR